MDKNLIIVGSITYAMKSKEILSSNGILSYIEKITDGKPDAGCGYALNVPNDFDSAYRILNQSGMKIRSVRRGKRP